MRDRHKESLKFITTKENNLEGYVIRLTEIREGRYTIERLLPTILRRRTNSFSDLSREIAIVAGEDVDGRGRLE